LSFEDLKRRHSFSDDLIHFTLDELRRRDLLAETAAPEYFAGLSRREVLKRIGLTSVAALPVIASIVAPNAAHAASNCPPASDSNIPPGCPVGSSFLASGSCETATDTTKNGNCTTLYAGRCQSRSAVYRPNSCSNGFNNYRISCDCG
jgi:hypothetical protein